MTAAAMPQVTDNGKTWLIRLKKGIVFQADPAFKGRKRELTVNDYIYAFKRLMDPKVRSPNLGIFENKLVGGDEVVEAAKKSGKFDYDAPLPGLQALDRYTVEIKTPVPNPFLVADPNRIASVGIVPREAIEKLGEDGFARRPIGSGPFALKSFSTDQGAVLERNPNYWLPVYLDKVEFVVIPDPTVQILALTAGEVDIVPYLFNLDSMASVAKNPKLATISRGGSYRGLGFNVTKPPFDELEVRELLARELGDRVEECGVLRVAEQQAHRGGVEPLANHRHRARPAG